MFQILVFAIIWTWGCKQLRKENNIFKNKVLQYIVTLIICILPVNFMYSITIWKDILYSYSFLAILICIFNFIKNDFKLTIKDIILLTLALVCVIRFRHNGFIIGFVMFGLVLIINFIKQRKIKISFILVISFIMVYLITGLPEKILIKNETKQESTTSEKSIYRYVNGTLLHAMGAILNSDIEIDEEDLEFLNNILDIEIWKENYNPYTAGGIHYNKKLNSSAYVSKEDNDKFGDIFIKYAKRNPYIVLKHFIKLNTIDWSIKEYAYLNNVVLENTWISEMSGGKYDNHPKLNKMHNLIYKYIEMTWKRNTIYILLYRPVIPMIVSIILILVLSLKKKTYKYILILLPMFLNIAPYIILITSQDHRYFYPSYMTCYFTIIMFFSIITKSKMQEICNKNIKLNKVAVVIPINNIKEFEKSKRIINKIDNIYDVIIIENGVNYYDMNSINKNVNLLKIITRIKKSEVMQCAYKYANENDYDVIIEGNDIDRYEEMLKMIEKEKAYIIIDTNEIQKKSKYNNLLFKIKNKYNNLIVRFYTDKKLTNSIYDTIIITKPLIKEFSENSYSRKEKIIKTIIDGKKIIEI